jgi:hypothetical protein
MVFVEKGNKYFVVYSSNSDIYAKWLKPDGRQSGEEILIYSAPGSQSLPMVAYSPVKKRFLIVWRDDNAPGDFEPAGPGAPMAPEVKADVRGAIYGSP